MILLPLLLVVAARTRSWRWTVPVVLSAPALAWTYARSAYGGAVVVIVVLAITGVLGARYVGRMVVALWLALPLLATVSFVDVAFRTQSAVGAVDARVDRLPLVLDVASGHPFTGLGFTALQAKVAVSSTDSSLLLAYAETGVVGVVALVLLLVAAIAACGSGFTSADRELRAFAIAGAVSAAAMGVASVSFDTFSGPQALRPLFLVVAFGVVAAERSRQGRPDPLVRDVPWRRLWLGAAALAVGLGLVVVAPRTEATELEFTVGSTGIGSLGSFGGRVLVDTVCDQAAAQAALLEVDVQCDLDRRFTSVDVGTLRIAAPELRGRDTRLLESLRSTVPSVAFHVVREERGAIPAPFRTAPLWLPLLAGGLVLLSPRPRRRRRPPGSGGRREGLEPALSGRPWGVVRQHGGPTGGGERCGGHRIAQDRDETGGEVAGGPHRGHRLVIVGPDALDAGRRRDQAPTPGQGFECLHLRPG